MKDIYKNNQEIVVFFNKAQNRIGELADFITTHPDEDDEEIRLLLDLSDFLECLDSIYCTYSISDVLRYIHFFNRRANLTNIPFIQVTDYVVNIYTGNGGSTVDQSTIESIVRSVLTTFPHNSLAGLQGGSVVERYHLTKAQVNWVICQMAKTPCPDLIDPSVSLVLTSNKQPFPSGYYELGTTVGVNVLQGSIQLNSGKSVLSTKYRKNGSILPNSEVLSPITLLVNPYTDTTSLNMNTTYAFESVFEVGGSKSDSRSINFLPPMYYGILRRDQVNSTSVKTLVKDVKPVQSMDLSFHLTIGNTQIDNGRDYTPVVEFPASYGIPSSIKVLGFEFINDWSFIQTTNTLQDGSTIQVVRGIFKNSIEGDFTFSFYF